jgi:thioester reductase-like protein
MTATGPLIDDGAVATTEVRESSSWRVRSDAELDPALRPAPPRSEPTDPTPRVLLTGATGFLGAYLLQALVESGAEVCCLLRDSGTQPASERLPAHLGRLGLSLAGLPGRVSVLAGDLAQPRFGLPETAFAELAESVDVIYHAASQVNLVKPYAELRHANVLGLHELVRLAAASWAKPLHCVSTLALFFRRDAPGSETPPRAISENDWPELDEDASSGYLQSKWAAEQLVRAAQGRGLPATIYRTGRISGHSQTGVNANPHDLLNLVIAASVWLGRYPDWDILINLTPVDYICRAIMEISTKGVLSGKSIHLFNPRSISFLHLMGLLRKSGYPIYPVAASDFQQAVTEAAVGTGGQRALFSKLALLLRSAHHLFSPRPEYLTPNSQPWLTEHGVLCPDINEDVISSYLAYFRQCGLLPTDPHPAR